MQKKDNYFLEEESSLPWLTLSPEFYRIIVNGNLQVNQNFPTR